jgi:putative membrane protein insertion efficiency factor
MTLLIPISTFLTGPAHASGSEWGPWDKDRAYALEQEPARQQTPHRNRLSTIAVAPGILLISFFQTVISPVDGASCDFYPTCSAYAKQALQKHGLFIGLAMASERLCRIHSPEGYEPVEKYGTYYYHDPVANNDFWFYKRKAGTP